MSVPIPAETPKPYYQFDVVMTCGGCSGAIERVLKKNVTSPNAFNVSLEKQQAVIWGSELPPIEDVEKVIAKTGKKVNSFKKVE